MNVLDCGIIWSKWALAVSFDAAKPRNTVNSAQTITIRRRLLKIRRSRRDPELRSKSSRRRMTGIDSACSTFGFILILSLLIDARSALREGAYAAQPSNDERLVSQCLNACKDHCSFGRPRAKLLSRCINYGDIASGGHQDERPLVRQIVRARDSRV